MTNPSIPKIKGDFLLGSLRQFKHNPLQTMIDWQRDYGDLIEFNIGLQRFYLVNHPNLAEQALIQQSDVFVKMYNPAKPKGLNLILGQGLVTSQGDLWRKQRRIIQPMLQKRNLANLLPQMQTAGEAMLNRWQHMGEHTTIDLAQEMLQLALEVITQTMFSTSLLKQVEQIAPALEIALKYAAKTVSNPFTLPLWIPTSSNQDFNQAKTFLDNLIYGLIHQRRSNPDEHQDLLTMLLSADENGEKMSDQQIRDEVITIFTAGHETTANALTWTLYLLAKHPTLLAKVQQELQHVLAGNIADNQTLPNLTYTRAVLDESMRLRPPVGILMRRVSKNTEIAGYQLKAGSLAIFNIYNIHHHPKLWEHPEQFNPERFLTESKLEKFSYIPFGIGARMCVGNQFALFESLLLLSMILQRYQLHLLNQEEVSMEMNVSIRPKQRIIMQLQSR